MRRTHPGRILAFACLLIICGTWLLADGQSSARQDVPPIAAAEVDVGGSRIAVRYNGHTILAGTVTGGTVRASTHVYRDGDRLQQVVALTPVESRQRLRVGATITGSGQSFSCEADPQSRGPALVRHTSGISRNLRNRAVYDRSEDWVLSVDAGPAVVISPLETSDAAHTFALDLDGRDLVLRFRPRYYQQHRGLKFFEPWTYTPWRASVAGWISWFAFFDRVTERDIVETADVLGEVLAPFGYEYLQIDDGYQRGRGTPDAWLNANDKFPHGLAFLADYIRGKGLKPGIWTAASFADASWAEAHADLFVRDETGGLARGNWIDYAVDATNPAALDTIVRPLYRGLRQQGWDYFKVDALRHLRYEGYNANREYFDRKGADLVDAYRKYATSIRDEIGRDHFVLGCWGIRPELIGIIDGCRIGDDGFSYAGLAQYNSFNNVVWRNDPDHIELNEQAFTSTMVTTLTGSLLMLTDRPAVYRTAAVEPARRAAPVLFTWPGQLYDVDPSRSGELARVDAEVSGGGPRPFDAGYTPRAFLYLLEIDRPFENWSVLGRTGGDEGEIAFADLGLDPSREYYVFEFWTKRLRGSFRGGFQPGPLDPRYKAQAFCLRARQATPQLIATSRHVTCGGVDLLRVQWDGARLVGRSRVVAGDPYVLYLTEPDGYRYERLEAAGTVVKATVREGGLVRVTLAPAAGGEVDWIASFSRVPPSR